MRRRASIAPWCLSLILLSLSGGCSWLGARKGSFQELPTREQATQAQQISERAQEAFDRGDFEQARMELLQLVALSPRAAEAHQRLGKVLELEGRLSEADACFRRAARARRRLYRRLDRARQDRGRAGRLAIGPQAVRDGDRDRAARCRGALRARPDAGSDGQDRRRPGGLLSDARIQSPAGPGQPPHWSDSTGAEPARPGAARLDQAVDLDGADGELRLLRGRAHLALRHIPEAVADFRAAAIRLPDRADVYFQLAVALEAAHQKSDALQAAEQALRLAPDYADARDLSRRLR